MNFTDKEKAYTALADVNAEQREKAETQDLCPICSDLCTPRCVCFIKGRLIEQIGIQELDRETMTLRAIPGKQYTLILPRCKHFEVELRKGMVDDVYL